jgi:hypothetical protein
MMSPVGASDFILTVKVTNNVYGAYSSGGVWYYQGGLIPFRYLDNDNLVVLVFLQDRIQLQISDVYHWHVLGTYALSDPYGQHELSISASGTDYRVWLDGVLAISASFGAGDCPTSSLSLGDGLGLWVYENAMVSFDDFIVTECFDVGCINTASVKLWHAFEDDFEDSAKTAAQWQPVIWSGTGQEWQVRQDNEATGTGVYHASGPYTMSRMVVAGHPFNVGDFIAEYKVKWVAGPWFQYGLMFHGSPNNERTTSYMVYVSNYQASPLWQKEIRLIKLDPTLPSDPYWGGPGGKALATVPFVPSMNTWYDFKVVAEGSNIQVFLNDVLKIAISDTSNPFLSGTIGLINWHSGADHVHFDDVSVLSHIADALVEPASIGDYDCDSVPDLMVKFDRATVVAYLAGHSITSGEVTLTVTGENCDGTQFGGSDSIRVISKGKIKL